MFDDLRQEADSSMMFDDEDVDALEMEPRPALIFRHEPHAAIRDRIDDARDHVHLERSFCLIVSQKVMLPFL